MSFLKKGGDMSVSYNNKGNTGLAYVYQALYCHFLYILYVSIFVIFKTAVLFEIIQRE